MLAAKSEMVTKKAELANAKEEKPQENAGEETQLGNDSFDLNKVQNALLDIIDVYKEKENNLEVTVLKQPVEIQENTITFKLNAEIQKDIFQKLRPDLNLLLRAKLNNHLVHLDCVINEDEETNGKRKLYTNTDKFNYLKEKSEALVELQRRFGLDTDF